MGSSAKRNQRLADPDELAEKTSNAQSGGTTIEFSAAGFIITP
jgi:hypothetical protein